MVPVLLVDVLVEVLIEVLIEALGTLVVKGSSMSSAKEG